MIDALGFEFKFGSDKKHDTRDAKILQYTQKKWKQRYKYQAYY